MLLDDSELYWLPASRAGIIHKKIKDNRVSLL
jgi:hypothetical protein